ncbi:hypothetical protein NTGZN8_150021 [Candidatus Nitrotoga fabula]|uniref:Uncharacterized protein n=1 Tax=Candidatus Nitrotoga fabula TaxID=2182327 RepID=A0A916BBH7_9PROT|nr:hypothetical protein NTGZN8_150021 [Candidatus Nitrotoga fabula]
MAKAACNQSSLSLNFLDITLYQTLSKLNEPNFIGVISSC